ncbi:MAG: hypothetical protein PVH82_06895 [Desulfobacteraceae bacterium]|jgi:hypothetical protein
MILNVFSITETFVGLISLILMGWAGILSLRLALNWQRASTVEEKSEVEKKSHLVLLVAVVVLGIRLINWPMFYMTLQSFVPDIDGAMCIFGVTQVKRVLTGISEIIKPVAFFLVGAWLLIHILDQKTETSPLMGRKLLFLSATAAVVVAESLLDVVLMLQIAPGTLVSCCTTVTDILDRPTRLVPQSTLGTGYASILGYGYYVSNIVLILILAVFMWRLKPKSYPRWQRPVLGCLFLFAILNGALFLLTQIEVHAPKTMGLPYHHCLYCLWQYVPDSILMYLFFILGTSAVGWAFLLDLMGRSRETKNLLYKHIKMLCGFSVFCIIASMVMNTVHQVAT